MAKKLNNQERSQEEILYQLLKREHGYYKAILDIETESTDKLENGCPMYEFRTLLEKKRALISHITDIEIALEPLKTFWKNKKDRSDRVSLCIQREIEILDKILRQILNEDLHNQKIMEHRIHASRQALSIEDWDH